MSLELEVLEILTVLSYSAIFILPYLAAKYKNTTIGTLAEMGIICNVFAGFFCTMMVFHFAVFKGNAHYAPVSFAAGLIAGVIIFCASMELDMVLEKRHQLKRHSHN